MTKRPAPLTAEMVSQGVAMLRQLDAERQAKRARVALLPSDSSDDDEDASSSPVFDSFLQEGPDSIKTLTNFTPEQLEQVWTQVVRSPIEKIWNSGRGRRSRTKPKDAFFMLLVTLKNAGQWDVLAGVFGLKPGSFQKLVNKVADIVAPLLYEHYVASSLDKHPMAKLITEEKTFYYHPYARYATGSMFQQTNVPVNRAKTRSLYEHAKLLLYGYKTQVSVLPNGTAVHCTGHAPGNEADAEIFRRAAPFHAKASRKTDAELEITDDGELVDTFPDSWAVLADKDFRPLGEAFRVAAPLPRSPDQANSLEHLETKKSLAHDRRVVKNYLGRLTTLWAICSDKFRWDEAQYDTYFRACVALTNALVSLGEPLNDEDGANFKRYQQELLETGAELREKRNETRKKYREKTQKRRDEAQTAEASGTEATPPSRDSSRRRLEIRPSP